MADEPVALASWLAEKLAENFAASIETMSGEKPEVSSRPAGAAAGLEGALWWAQPLSLAPGPALWLGVPEASWLAIGKHILISAGVESTEASEARSTFLEISSQALSSTASAVGTRAGKTVSCENGAEADGPEPGSIAFEIELKLGEAEAVVLRLHVAPALVAAMAPAEAPAQAEASPAQPLVPQPKRPASSPNTLDLLMEVELPVSVSFGRADLPLKDVLKLTTGSIIELNRVLSEPVEVIVNNCVVARGEVVVIDGNYGVRIQEIISRDKRLRTLR
ncbi:MAG TPA: flagellar motor switch protein FliN [Bryobacteraceae bacterium]|nr:flagellar motor switch protein FliN [Bryobacteraceae bacterium]